eukprot:g15431.t1
MDHPEGLTVNRSLMETVKVAKLDDVFSPPLQMERTIDITSCAKWVYPLSDRFPMCVPHVLSQIHRQIKPVVFSDHCLLLAGCHLQDNQRASKGTRKLNVKPLTRENIEELKRDYTGWRAVKPLFQSPSD